MSNQFMNPTTKVQAFYNMGPNQHKKVNSIDGIEYQQQSPPIQQITMSGPIGPGGQIRNLRSTANNKMSNIQSQGNTQINSKKIKVHGHTQ